MQELMQILARMKIFGKMRLENCTSYAVTYAQFNKIQIITKVHSEFGKMHENEEIQPCEA